MANGTDKHIECLDKLSDKIDGIKTDIFLLDKKFSLHAQKMDLEIYAIKKLDEHQDKLLEEQTSRSTTYEKRLDKVEDAHILVSKEVAVISEKPKRRMANLKRGFYIAIGSSVFGIIYYLLQQLDIIK